MSALSLMTPLRSHKHCAGPHIPSWRSKTVMADMMEAMDRKDQQNGRIGL